MNITRNLAKQEIRKRYKSCHPGQTKLKILPSLLLETNEHLSMSQNISDSPLQSSANYTDVVYIVAPTQRSGTNFLGELIKTCGQFHIPEPLTEAHFLKLSPRLVTYANDMIDYHSNPEFFHQEHVEPNDYKELMAHELGESLLRFCSYFKPEDKRLLLKVPHSGNIDNVFHLFPNAKLLLLARDGRDVVESTLRTWPEKEFKHECKKWGWRTKLFTDFMEAHVDQENEQWMFLRYEELIHNPVYWAEQIFEFIGVAKQDWQEQDILDLPIFGSSTYRGEKQTERIHFQPVAKQNNERFTYRWEHWSSKQKRRFKRRAGDQLMRLGYAGDKNW